MDEQAVMAAILAIIAAVAVGFVRATYIKDDEERG